VQSYSFKALGTAWSISIDQAAFISDTFWQKVVDTTSLFEQRFSRFIDTSESRAFAEAKAGTYPVSAEMTRLLVAADKLRQLTKGQYDPAIGSLLEAAGYNKSYTLKPNEQYIKEWQLPNWQIDAKNLQVTIDRPLVFDFGGIGKGYWIDQLSQLLIDSDFPFHIIEGGGDMMATSKQNGQGWRVAIEYPGKPEMALGLSVLKNQGFAASDMFRRRWGSWHHFIDHQKKSSQNHILGCAVIAPNAWQADQATSILSLTDPAQATQLVNQLGVEYLVVGNDDLIRRSSHWPGQLF